MRRTMLSLTSCPCPSSLGRRGYQMVNTRRGGRRLRLQRGIWNALDRLAARAGLSASGLAKKAGLDPATFNKSKRLTPDGHARWPSTESVAKSLAATGTRIDVLVQLISDGGRAVVKKSVPLIALAQAGKSGYFDDAGFPVGHGFLR